MACNSLSNVRRILEQNLRRRRLTSSNIHFLSSCSPLPQTLQSHYVPAVAGLVKKLLYPDASKVEEDLSKYLEINQEQVLTPTT